MTFQLANLELVISISLDLNSRGIHLCLPVEGLCHHIQVPMC